MADPLEALAKFLEETYNNPFAYIVLTFFYAIAVAVILPIPIEAALLPPLIQKRFAYLAGLTIALAAGKTVGAWLVFILGVNVEGTIQAWSRRWRFAAWFVQKAQVFVARTGSVGLYVLLSIPLMSDTIPLYLYALFNAEGKALDPRMYLAANFLSALNRVAILVVVYILVGVNLFHL